MTNFLKKVTPFQILLVLFFAACLVCGFSFSRQLIILLMEKIIGRSLNDMTKWNAVISGSMAFFAVCALFTYFFVYVDYGKKAFAQMKDKILALVTSPKFVKIFFSCFAIVIVAYIALLRSNYDFADDTKRIISGHKSWVGASRYVSEILSVFLHTNFYLNDISPLSQLISIAVLVFAALVLCYSFNDQKFTVPALASCLLFTVSPYYFENLSYKFDSPYMALAMLFGILPFLFRKEKSAYICSSIVCLLLALTSYQAANSIYIVLTIYATLIMLLKNEEKKEVLNFVITSIVCYIVALVIFRVFVMIPTEATISERDTSVGAGGMISLFKSNLCSYSKIVLFRFGNIWIKFFALVLTVTFPFAGAYYCKSSKIKGAIISIAALSLMFLLSFGAYLIIGNTVIADRAFMGFDVLVSVIALFDVISFTSGKKKLVTCIAVYALLYGFVVQAIITGNLYAKQLKYEEFRYSILLNDLSEIVDFNKKNKLLLDGSIGDAVKTHMEYKNYPIFPIGGLTGGWAKYYLEDWNFEADFLQIEASSERIERNPEFKALKENLPLIKDTYYHTIKGKDDTYYVYFKNPRVTEYEK